MIGFLHGIWVCRIITDDDMSSDAYYPEKPAQCTDSTDKEKICNCCYY
ncbi:MAG: hypothetical protein V8Q69_12730 [Bacteroides caccae]